MAVHGDAGLFRALGVLAGRADVDGNATLWGLRLYEWLTLIGIIIGPIAAVIITLAFEQRRRTRDSQIQVMRMLLNTRHMPSDPSYTVAINLVPVEFNRQKAIMAAWKGYIDHVRFAPTEANADAHHKVAAAKQTDMIYRIMRHLGFNLSETELQTSAYAARGFIERDDLYLDSLRAWPRLATALEHSNYLTYLQMTGQPHPSMQPEHNSDQMPSS
jgi:hypothetical protein